jgi:hypothetical protein
MLLADDRTSTDLRPLRAHCTGDVVVPGERIWPEVLDGWSGLAAGQEPAAVIYPASEYDVAAVRSYVAYAGLDVVVEGGGELPEDLAGVVLVHRPATRPPWAA